MTRFSLLQNLSIVLNIQAFTWNHLSQISHDSEFSLPVALQHATQLFLYSLALSTCVSQWCGLRPSVLGQDRSETKKSVLVLVLHKKIGLGLACCSLGLVHCSLGLGLGLAGLVLFCEIQSCHAHRHNDLEGRSNFSSTIYSFSILCLEHHYCGDQQWHSLT